MPYCYTGETLLLRTIAEKGLRERISIRLRAFELDPSFPKGKTIDVPLCVAKKYGCGLQEALAKIEMAENMARASGLDMKFRTANFCNTRDSHRLLKFAYAQYGDDMALKLNFTLFAAYFTQNLVLDDENLVKIAQSAGMDSRLSEDVLKMGKFDAEVAADEREASERAIYSIPYFNFNGQLSVAGAMPLKGFLDALEKMTRMNGENE